MADPAARTTSTRYRSSQVQPARTAEDVQDRRRRQGSSNARRDTEQHSAIDKNGTRRRHHSETQEKTGSKDTRGLDIRSGTSAIRRVTPRDINGTSSTNPPAHKREESYQDSPRQDLPDNQPNLAGRRLGLPPRASFQQQWEQTRAIIGRGIDNALPGANRPMKTPRNWDATEWFFFRNILCKYCIFLTILFIFFLLWCFNPMGWLSWRKELWDGFRAWRGGQELIDRNERNRLEAERIFAPLEDVLNPRVEFLHG